jgi:dTDP-4-dehydrorhamnose reductase
LVAALRATGGDTGGVFHMSAAGATTWHRFAQAIFEELPDPARRLCELVPIAAREYPSPAARPANSLLDNGYLRATWGVVLPEWREGLRLCAQSLR